MCLYPKIILNPKYRANKKNGGKIPPLPDERVKYVSVGCGKCVECCHQKANGWRQRLMEELKVNKGKFITLTFSDESIKNLAEELEVDGQCNAVAGLAIRRFLERWRKKHSTSIKHFFITELGSSDKTERLHLHGVLFIDSLTKENLTELWKYGKVDIGNRCGTKAINYIVKYIHKPDSQHPNYQPQTFCSAGIGKNYIDKKKNAHKYKDNKTNEQYNLENGFKLGLSMYYRNHFFSEEEREKLWIEKLDKMERWVRGQRIDISKNEKEYWFKLKNAQKENRRLGYPEPTWEKDKYSITLRMLKKRNPLDSTPQSVGVCLPRSLRSHGGGRSQRAGLFKDNSDTNLYTHSSYQKMQEIGRIAFLK